MGLTMVFQQFRPSHVEDQLLRRGVRRFWAAEADTAHPGSSSTVAVALTDGTLAFHKTLAGIDEPQAALFGHDSPSVLVNESAAWMIAKALGQPWTGLVPVTVLRSLWPRSPLPQGYGALGLKMVGRPAEPAPLHDPNRCDPAAFFDVLIGQQDRHVTNYRWDVRTESLRLIDNGYAFAAPGAFASGSVFAEARHDGGRSQLTDREQRQLDGLLDDRLLLGNLQMMLREDQFGALVERARRMQASGELLELMEF